MRLTFLGTGGAFTDYRVNYQNNAVIETDEGLVLIDCGHTAVQSLKELGYSALDVRAVLFTHLHGDHASPEQLLWERFYGTRPDGEVAFERTELCGPADLLDPLRASLDPFLDIYTAPGGDVRTGGVNAIVEARVGAVAELAGLEVRWFRVPHVTGPAADKPAYGLDIRMGGSRVLWSGDTTFSPRWVKQAAEDPTVARVFHECSFSEPYRGAVHTHWSELESLPEPLLSRITLMHHTEVPEGVDVSGTAGAADRHESFDL